jgi:hypothetical protein
MDRQSKFQFRVVSKRAGQRERAKLYATLRGAQRRAALYGPEPWTAHGRSPEELWCCDGNQCPCGGDTVRQHHESLRRELPALEFVRIERRRVSAWEEY